MSQELEDQVEAVEKVLRGTKARIAALADTPHERLRLAVEGRNPDGFTEVFCADVVAVASGLSGFTDEVRELAAAAHRNLHGAFGKPLPTHKAKEFVCAHGTRAILELLTLRGNP